MNRRHNDRMQALRDKDFYTPPPPFQYPNPFRLASTNALLTAMLRQQAPGAVPTTSVDTATVSAGTVPAGAVPGESRSVTEARAAASGSTARGGVTRGTRRAVEQIDRTRATSKRLASDVERVRDDFTRTKAVFAKKDRAANLKRAASETADRAALAALQKTYPDLDKRKKDNAAVLAAEKSAGISAASTFPSVKKAYDAAQKEKAAIEAASTKLTAAQAKILQARLRKKAAAAAKSERDIGLSSGAAKATTSLDALQKGSAARTTTLKRAASGMTAHERTHGTHNAAVVKHEREETEAMKQWRGQFGPKGGLRGGGGKAAGENAAAAETAAGEVFVAAQSRTAAEKQMSHQVQRDQSAVVRAKWIASSDAAALKTLSDKLTSELAAYNEAEQNAAMRATNRLPKNPRDTDRMQAHTAYVAGRARDWAAYTKTATAFNAKMRQVYADNSKPLPRREAVGGRKSAGGPT